MIHLLFHLIVKLNGGPLNVKNKINSKNLFIRKIYAEIFKTYCWLEGAYIGTTAIVPKNTILPHGMKSIFISGGAKIGDNCTIYQQVTIGSNLLSDSKGYGFPSIGNNCIIGAGAKIIGNVTIGNNVRIGANAVVVEDIPSNSIVVLNKPRIIKK